MATSLQQPDQATPMNTQSGAQGGFKERSLIIKGLSAHFQKDKDVSCIHPLRSPVGSGRLSIRQRARAHATTENDFCSQFDVLWLHKDCLTLVGIYDASAGSSLAR